jgi:hypothetical protein
MSRKLYWVGVLLTCNLIQSFAQYLPFGIRFNTGMGVVVYDANTRQYFNPTVAGAYSVALNYRNFFSSTIFTRPFSRLKDSLMVNGVEHPSTENLKLTLQSWTIGYSFLLPDQRLSIDPYIGLHKTFIENDNGKTSFGSQLGYCGGAYLYYYNKPILNGKVQWYYFLNNQLSFTQLYKLNNQLGNIYYSFQIGFGVRWGSMKDYWQGRY